MKTWINSTSIPPQWDWCQCKLTLRSFFTCQKESASETLGERLSDVRLSWASLGCTAPLDTFQAFWNIHEKLHVPRRQWANNFIPTFSLKSSFKSQRGWGVSEYPDLFIMSLADGMCLVYRNFQARLSCNLHSPEHCREWTDCSSALPSITHRHGHGETRCNWKALLRKWALTVSRTLRRPHCLQPQTHQIQQRTHKSLSLQANGVLFFLVMIFPHLRREEWQH